MFMVGVFVAPQGFYKGGQFVFSFKVPQAYPHEPPKVKCETLVYHPNIDLEGNICLNILRLVAVVSTCYLGNVFVYVWLSTALAMQ